MPEQNVVCPRHHWSQLDALNHTMLDGFQAERAECPYCRLRLRDDRIADLERKLAGAEAELAAARELYNLTEGARNHLRQKAEALEADNKRLREERRNIAACVWVMLDPEQSQDRHNTARRALDVFVKRQARAALAGGEE